jgi:hypothetical protein
MRAALASLLLLVFAAAAPAAVIHVPGDQPAIRMGITAAADGDTVLVAAGVWSGSLNRNLDLYGKAITVLGAGPGQSVIDCEGAARGFMLLGGETPATVIEGFSIVNGFGIYGGAIEIDSASATLRNLSIEDCSATKGGGISIRFAVGTVLVEGVILARGTASSGGGAYSYFSDVDYRGVTAVGNAATAYSAAFHVSTGNVTFTRCLIAWNEDLPAVNGTFAADPRFCDAAAGDFSLDADSPCLPAHNDCGQIIGAFGQGCGATAAETPPVAGFAMASHPNPFNPSTTLRFTLSAPSAVTLTVHDLAGRRVATLLDGQRCEAGPQSAVWDGRLDAGGRAASGVYLVRLAATGREEAHKIALLK